MKKLLVALLACTLAVSAFCYAQTPKPDASRSQNQPCVIVKRHVHKFGENMSRLHAHRPYDYVEGDYPHQDSNGALNSVMETLESFSKEAGSWWL